MAHVIYKIVKHGEGWAYQVGQTFSETFRSHDDARAAALSAAHEHEQLSAAHEHEQTGNTVGIAFEDSVGQWHDELSKGNDRPVTPVFE